VASVIHFTMFGVSKSYTFSIRCRVHFIHNFSLVLFSLVNLSHFSLISWTEIFTSFSPFSLLHTLVTSPFMSISTWQSLWHVIINYTCCNHEKRGKTQDELILFIRVFCVFEMSRNLEQQEEMQSEMSITYCDRDFLFKT
jgi:hypothetical protein